MASSLFQFGFGGDDIEEDPAEKPLETDLPTASRNDAELLQNDPKLHALEDLVCQTSMLCFSYFSSSEMFCFFHG